MPVKDGEQHTFWMGSRTEAYFLAKGLETLVARLAVRRALTAAMRMLAMVMRGKSKMVIVRVSQCTDELIQAAAGEKTYRLLESTTFASRGVQRSVEQRRRDGMMLIGCKYLDGHTVAAAVP